MSDADRAAKASAKPYHLEHRKRLRTRFLRDLGQHMEDYELLELLLCQAIPRKDVKPLAKALIDRFGSLANVLSADPVDLARENGLGEAAVVGLKVVQQASLRLLRTEVEDTSVLSSWQAVLDYCRAAMAREKVEQFRLLFLDNRNRLIADEVQQRGTIDHTPLYLREVVKRALELGAGAIIMVHNHPSGDPTPSRDDIEVTRTVQEALGKIGIRLHDHIVIGRNDFVSLKTDGLM